MPIDARMTEVVFHFNATDPLEYVCRLLRKALAKGSKVVVTGPPHILSSLDRDLWTFSPTDFIPHCRTDADVAPVTPILLTESLPSAPSYPVLVNLGNPITDGFDRFPRVIEVVSTAEEDRKAARARYKAYDQAGFPITRFDIQNSATR